MFATYLGGSGDDRAVAIAVDRFGNAIITGSTDSTNFPVTSAFQAKPGGGQDAFVVKFNAAGSALVYSTYLGGRGGGAGFPETGTGVVADPDGNAYVTGATSSTDFPTWHPLNGRFFGGGTDAFAVKLSPGGAIVYGTFLGGSSMDMGCAIAVGAAGSAYIAGYTASTDIPVVDPVQKTNGGILDAFVLQLAPEGDAIVFGTYLGGSNSEAGYGIAVSPGGSIYVAGQTLSYDFPLVNPARISNSGNFGGFVARLVTGNTPPHATISPSAGSGVKPEFYDHVDGSPWRGRNRQSGCNVQRGTDGE